ncbi:PA14 domain-containing protein [Pseudobacteriovorax antillogorgiicola]|uniref:PA14 domain-containing protein n=1 Tax=Pseudobacteriovorax antillogorgiicola TaxID=1513793 RepID=A0A1Y6CQ29_9BACT|nr:PA14 domain-containing protein [Pseudobacteriovorax antillogorgiicola]TCS46993.1 PA14 domain-containing protein [Pseudobacteriovorax antillogorgiicola]SMF64898.1 PA14 domain-containing protein [Pseudobacteriovorax antillogorgiicola]
MKKLSIIMLFLIQCSNKSGFHNKVDEISSLPSLDREIEAAGTATVPEAIVPVIPQAGEQSQVELPPLTLKPSLFSMRAGSEGLQFQVLMGQAPFQGDVEFTVVGQDLGGDLGSIDDQGMYVPPANTVQAMDIEIEVKALDGTDRSAESSGLISPESSLFIVCKEGDNLHPMIARLYALPEETERLPENFLLMKPQGYLCMDQLDIAPRDFSLGFPGVTNRFEWFALDVQSLLWIEEPGDYYIGIRSDDGSRVFLNDQLIIDNDGQHSPEEKGVYITLTPGYYPLRIHYFQGPRYTLSLELLWQLPDSDDKVHIPQNNLRYPSLIKPWKRHQNLQESRISAPHKKQKPF